jgi:hypothetical protein
MDDASSDGMVATINHGNTRAVTIVKTKPTTAAGTASTSPSTISCRTMRPRLAPSASRTPNSR